MAVSNAMGFVRNPFLYRLVSKHCECREVKCSKQCVYLNDLLFITCKAANQNYCKFVMYGRTRLLRNVLPKSHLHYKILQEKIMFIGAALVAYTVKSINILVPMVLQRLCVLFWAPIPAKYCINKIRYRNLLMIRRNDLQNWTVIRPDSIPIWDDSLWLNSKA